jgi:hypothetical protein
LKTVQRLHVCSITRSDTPDLHNFFSLNKEWEISRLYVAVTFRKVPKGVRVKIDPAFRASHGKPKEEDDDVEIDAAFRAKNVIKALKAAKEGVGDDWGTLPEERKNELTEIQLKILAKSQK